MSLGSSTKSVTESGWWETAKVIIQALILAMIVRIFFYQPFNIPSGSMKGTLLVGDYLFVSKLSYGYSRYSFPWGMVPFNGRIWSGTPERGDTVQMRNGVLYINRKPIPKKRIADFETKSETGLRRLVPQYEETLPNGVTYRVLDEEPNGPFDNTNEFKVPAGHYFMMGDNRDNSTDSRAQWGVGYVPHQNLVGRAEVLFFSAETGPGGSFRLLMPWTWPYGIRWSRFFDLVR